MYQWDIPPWRNIDRPSLGNKRVKRMKEKRAVLDGVAAALRRIIGRPTVKVAKRSDLRFAA
jgi:hypothetical protein